jgi:hypothetical protein
MNTHAASRVVYLIDQDQFIKQKLIRPEHPRFRTVTASCVFTRNSVRKFGFEFLHSSDIGSTD